MESDEALYRRVKEGDMRAFDALYGRYEARLFGFLLSLLKDRAEAEDVFQDAFLRALKSREVTFDRGASFKTWLYRIARNLTLNRVRSDTREARAFAKLEDDGHVPPADLALARMELLQALDVAVANLPAGLAEVYHLRSSGLSYDEMAAILEIPVGTLKSRMNRMVTVLREELRPWSAS